MMTTLPTETPPFKNTGGSLQHSNYNTLGTDVKYYLSVTTVMPREVTHGASSHSESVRNSDEDPVWTHAISQ